MKRILVIDDDLSIGNMLEEALCKEGYLVSRAYSGTEALLVLASVRPDLVLLDLMLPGLCGEEVLANFKGIPVIVVSAKVDTDSKVSVLLEGAVDYVTKPFELKELLARIVVALRHSPSLPNAVLSFSNLRLDPASRSVSLLLNAETSADASTAENASAQEVHLTRTEFAILKLLMQNPSQVLTKSLLLERISEDTPDCTESSLKIHVSNLRRKLREAGGSDYIESVWGIGFKLRE